MMNGNISIKKLWYDEDFYEVQIIMNTEQIHCKIKTYIVDEEINALSQKNVRLCKKRHRILLGDRRRRFG